MRVAGGGAARRGSKRGIVGGACKLTRVTGLAAAVTGRYMCEDGAP